MATIVKRGKNFYVVFRYDDANGNSQQKWESFKTKKEAKSVKARSSMRSTPVPLFHRPASRSKIFSLILWICMANGSGACRCTPPIRV